MPAGDRLEGFRSLDYQNLDPGEREAYRFQRIMEDVGQGVSPLDIQTMWLGELADRFLTGVTDADETRVLGREIARAAETEVRAWAQLALDRDLDDPEVRSRFHAAKSWFQLLGHLRMLITQAKETNKRINEEGAADDQGDN